MNVAGCSGRRGQAEEQGPMGRTQERPRARKPRGQGHERVEEILAAAKALYAEGGYEFTTTRRIAGRVGVSQTALYTHFPDKDAILMAVCARAFDDLAARLEIEARRVGKECVSTCSSRWSPYH